MKIQKVTITEKELCKAVEIYLVTQGVSLPVASVEKDYSYSSNYTVEFVEPDESPVPIPAAAPKPELTRVDSVLPTGSSDFPIQAP